MAKKKTATARARANLLMLADLVSESNGEYEFTVYARRKGKLKFTVSITQSQPGPSQVYGDWSGSTLDVALRRALRGFRDEYYEQTLYPGERPTDSYDAIVKFFEGSEIA